MNNLNQKRTLLKANLRNRKPVFAGWTSIGHPSITEIFTGADVDFIGIDIEHSTISQEQSQRIIAACHAGGCLCLPRIASHNGEMIKRLLDSGADGIIVPMVSNPEEVEHIISWCKYFPQGKRSYGIAAGQGYGADFEEYTSNWNQSSIIIIQIESTEGVENIDELLSFEQIDGAMIGPYDLSGSLGIPGQLNHPDVVSASQKVMKACIKHGKASGTQLVDPDLQQMKDAIDSDYTFIVLASDVFLLWKWADRMKEYINNISSQ
jgi:2-keto-3-deoxy-L-rhamnonate aldolase RhmA